MAEVTLNVVDSGRQVTVNLPEPKAAVLHEVVTWQLAKRRRGTASTKTRGQVRGSTRKLYSQKGTGRARHGAITAPIYVGGGTVFGPQPRSYSYSLPKKVRKLGLNMALSARAGEGKLTLVDHFDVPNGKTKEFVAWAKTHGFDGSERVLLVTDNELARRAARNLTWVGVLPAAGLNAYDILRYDHLLTDAGLLGEPTSPNGQVASAEPETQASQDTVIEATSAEATPEAEAMVPPESSQAASEEASE